MKYTCNGFIFDTLELACKYELFMRTLTGIFYAIETTTEKTK